MLVAMRFLAGLILWSSVVACDSKKLVEIPAEPESGGAAGEASTSGRGGSGGADAGTGPGGEGGAAGEPSSSPSYHFVGKAYVDVAPEGAGGDGGGGASGDGGAGGATDLPLTRVECDFYGDLVDIEPNDGGGFSGTVVGEVFRQLLSEDELSGDPILLFEFQALIGGPGQLTSDLEGNFELRIAGEQPADAKPFWQELEVLSGTESSPGHYGGSWTCASMMFDRDMGPDVPGTWTLEPMD
jgi:hypothetical protein